MITGIVADGFLFAKGRERAGGKDFSVWLTCLEALAYVSNQQSGCSR
jgi:hypothetical protein